MKKKLCCIITVFIIFLLAVASLMHYQNKNLIIGEKAYPVDSKNLDLLHESLSFDQYHTIKDRIPNCEILWSVPFQNSKFPSNSTNLSITTLTENDIAVLVEYFPNLESIDASSCHDYAMLMSMKNHLPKLEVIYTVSLGGKSFTPDTTELILANEDFDFSTMMENLVFLPEIDSIQFKDTELTLEQINEVKITYPQITVAYTFEILGQEYDASTTELDLSKMPSEDMTEVSSKLSVFPNLSTINLTNENGISNVAMEDVKLLMNAVPHVVFNYTFDFYGEKISTVSEEVYIQNKMIGDDGEATLRLALDLMQNCNRFVLDNCHISNEILSQIREDYRDKIQIVWRVSFGHGSALTDVEVIRSTYDLVDDNCHDLIYCEDVKYIDLGHNEYLDAVSFVAGMPKLEFAIISGAPIKDLSPFMNCKKLKILEIAYCSYIEDISPLASCESLEMLNICYTSVTDLSPLDNLQITHLCAISSSDKISLEEQNRFLELHPNCWSRYEGDQPYGPGWRYSKENKPLDWYENVCDIFGYPHALNNAGWYLDTH